MANPEHLKILRRGVKAWNQWRRKNPATKPELSSAKLGGRRLGGADFSGADLSHADLLGAKLLGGDFRKANLSHSNLIRSDLRQTNFGSANLRGAILQYATLVGASLYSANLSLADLVLSDFTDAKVGSTTFADNDLSKVKGLDSVQHSGPSSIGIDTLYKSEGKIPEKFLRRAGLLDEVIEHVLPVIRAGSPIQWHSCFISYSTKDEKFAKRLYSRMQQAGLRVWFAPEDMKGGQYSDEQIERAIQLHDRLLLVLSERSIQSKWVEREIRKARKVERAEKRRKLFPIRLVDMKTLREWECLDSDTGEDLAEEVRKYHIPDFSNWKNYDAFEHAFARLENDLRTSIGK